MVRSVSTFLMFNGQAEEAMSFYVSLFDGSRIERYGAGEAGPAGTAKRAQLALCGHRVMCFDSPIKHNFTFTPAVSLFVECADEAGLDAAFARLARGGKVLMPLDNY